MPLCVLLQNKTSIYLSYLGEGAGVGGVEAAAAMRLQLVRRQEARSRDAHPVIHPPPPSVSHHTTTARIGAARMQSLYQLDIFFQNSQLK